MQEKYPTIFLAGCVPAIPPCDILLFEVQKKYVRTGYRDILASQKISHEKSVIFTKTLNYINFSCVIFSVKMPRYFYYIYCLQEELTHFGLRVSTHIGIEVLRSISNIRKDFSCIMFYARLCQNKYFTYYLHITQTT